MANLRLITIKVFDSTTIKARFTNELDPLINVANVVINSNISSIPDPKVLFVSVTSTVLTITTQPLTPFAAYFITFQSTDTFKFKSKDGSSFLFEDGNTNVALVFGAEDPSDPIRDYLIGYLKDNIYNIDNGTIVRDIINSQSINIAGALHDIGQTKNDNYLSFTIENEKKTRGSGPYDRLNEEGAYEVIRVGKTISGSTASTSLSYDSFPSNVITLLTANITGEKLSAGTGDQTFNGLILTTSKNFVTKLKKVIVAYQDGGSATYDISVFGYQILEPKFDTDFASPLFTLANNQFKLSDSVLDSSFVTPKAGDFVFIDYEFEQKGRVIDEGSVVVSQVLTSTREVTPPLLNKFSLKAPIVTSTDVISTSNGVQFLDPNSNPPFSATHPAFLKEVIFNLDSLPNITGNYTIDYSTGTAYVYGASTNDGTGDFPPTATYNYRKTFSSRLDYTYDPDFIELVANPLRDLIGQTAKISFDYELVLVPDVDYIAEIHTEILDERIENRLVSSGALLSLNSPITNVFRIFNETSGELYKIQRWNNNKIYFTYNTSPRIINQIRERASFTNISNELLIVNTEVVNLSSIRIFSIVLANNRIINASEDLIGASFNSSVNFSRTDIFNKEIYFDWQEATINTNLNRLTIGDYQIDYENGILYVAISNSQNFDLGTVNYKKSTIAPQNSHVVAVSEIYYSISMIQGVEKRISYISFGEGSIQPSSFDISDERFLNGDTTLPYIVSSGQIQVSNNIKDVRNIFDAYDLNNNSIPTNFSNNITISANFITLDPDGVQKQEILTIEGGNTLTATFISAGIEIENVISVVRASDGIDLWSTPGTFSGYIITLSGVGSPIVGEIVTVIYDVILNGAATPIVDYNHGDYYIDYTYLADEILISYEYGDNVLDFREGTVLDEGDQYFVTYKAGALRDALLKNFGSLVNLPILNSFDTSFPRENYRDALMAALQSFPKGPTIPAIKAIVSNISHIDPEVIEAIFENWSLGISRLFLSKIKTTGDLQLLIGKYDLGVLIENSDETITFPISSNLRLEEGTLETWVIPEWDGLDNDASLTFTIMEDGYVLPVEQIYIGADSHNPTYDDNNSFTLNRRDTLSPIGLPSAIFTKTGMFIYYDDVGKRWKVYAKDNLNISHIYSGKITSSGEVYDVKFIPGLGEINDVIRSGTSSIDFIFNLDGYDILSPDGYVDGYSVIDGYFPGDGYVAGFSYDGMDFMADDEHYIFDFGKSETTNRFSIYKDGSGYLNFRVFDKGDRIKFGDRYSYKVSADISNWKAGEKHYVATSWRINSSDRRDELHLFIDGTEVPNILRYGGRPIATSSDRFRTVKPEIVAGVVPKNVITGNDLTTSAGSSLISSASINFQNLGILPGDTIEIFEPGFTSYNIISVTGNNLVISGVSPSNFTDARFSVNEYSVIVASEIDLSANIAVSVISGSIETEIPGLRADLPGYSVSINLLNQNVLTILGDAQAGDIIVIRTLGLNHRRCRDRQFIWGNTSNTLKTQLPPPINLDEAKITAIPLPLTSIGPNNSILTLGDFICTLFPTQTTNSTEGRTLSIRITGGNVNFSNPVTVTINGTPTPEMLSFTSAGTQTTINKFMTITSVVVQVTPIVTDMNSISIEIKEAFSITDPDGNNNYPIVRFSFQETSGTNLSGSGNTVQDLNNYFVDSNIGENLSISAPPSVAGTYSIIGRTDTTSLTISPSLPMSFTGGTYSIFNTTLSRSGFQNGFFTFELVGSVNVPYPLVQGFYELDYASYLEIPFKPINEDGYVGSDLKGKKQAKAILDEFRILSKMLTDVRVGESLATNQDSITTDYTSLRAFKPNSNTLMLLHFDSLPFENFADYWQTANREFIQSANSVNDNFEQCLVITNKPIILDNNGLLTTVSEGSIEFWVSPKYDTYNDPNVRYYFDASGSIIENVTSLTNGTVKVSGRINNVLSVRLATDTNNTGIDYFAGGTVNSDFQTISLQRALPYQQTPVKVNYVPSGLSGNRISIYKDVGGFINFDVTSQNTTFQVRQPIFWQRDTWHRITASYKFNRSDNKDEIRLFIDGEEKGVVRFGQGALFGDGTVFGQNYSSTTSSLIADINFTDNVNQLFIGSDYFGVNTAFARFDNLRLSDIARNPLTIAGQAKDINFNSNIDLVFPVIPDAFTTYLLDFDSLLTKTTDFALLINSQFGIFDFTLNIFDSFNIVLSNPKIKQVLENLINSLKPAQSRATLNYIS